MKAPKFGPFLYRLYTRSLLKLTKTRQYESHGPNYLKSAPAANQRLLYIHGLGDDMFGFLPCARHLVKDFQVIIPELPGLDGPGSDPRCSYDLDFYGRAMVKFLQDTGIETPLHVAGSSLGGAIALKLAEMRPDLVKTLILMDSAGFYFDDVPSVVHRFLNGDNPFQVRNPEEFRGLIREVFHRPPPMPGPLFDFFYQQIHGNYQWYGKLTADLIDPRLDPNDTRHLHDNTFNQRIEEMKMPVLIVWGKQDRLFPVEIAHRIHARFPNSRLLLIDKCGHIPQLEKARLTAKGIRRFILKRHDFKDML